MEQELCIFKTFFFQLLLFMFQGSYFVLLFNLLLFFDIMQDREWCEDAIHRVAQTAKVKFHRHNPNQRAN